MRVSPRIDINNLYSRAGRRRHALPPRLHHASGRGTATRHRGDRKAEGGAALRPLGAAGAPGGGAVAAREEDPGEAHQAADDVDEPVPADRRIRVAGGEGARARYAEDDEVVDALDPQRVLLFVASCQ